MKIILRVFALGFVILGVGGSLLGCGKQKSESAGTSPEPVLQAVVLPVLNQNQVAVNPSVKGPQNTDFEPTFDEQEPKPPGAEQEEVPVD